MPTLQSARWTEPALTQAGRQNGECPGALRTVAVALPDAAFGIEDACHPVARVALEIDLAVIGPDLTTPQMAPDYAVRFARAHAVATLNGGLIALQSCAHRTSSG
jgi:hypothetical protein